VRGVGGGKEDFVLFLDEWVLLGDDGGDGEEKEGWCRWGMSVMRRAAGVGSARSVRDFVLGVFGTGSGALLIYSTDAPSVKLLEHEHNKAAKYETISTHNIV
jgi:hypothetical protein